MRDDSTWRSHDYTWMCDSMMIKIVFDRFIRERRDGISKDLTGLFAGCVFLHFHPSSKVGVFFEKSVLVDS